MPFRIRLYALRIWDETPIHSYSNFRMGVELSILGFLGFFLGFATEHGTVESDCGM